MNHKRYRKTRKQKGGAGFLSLFKKPEPPSPKLPFESYKSSINRLYTFLYSRVNPEKANEILAEHGRTFVPLTSGQVILTQEQKDIFRILLTAYRSSTTNEDRTIEYTYNQTGFAQEVLGYESLAALNDAIISIEAVGTPIQDIILHRLVTAESYAKSFARFIPVVYVPETIIQYRQNWEQSICQFDREVDQNRPIQSLQEHRCIVILHKKSDFEKVLLEYQLVYGDSATIGPGFPYIVVKKEFLPQMNGKPFPYTRIRASNLMNISYVLDAFKQDGIREIQSDLARVIATEHKALWNASSIVQVKTMNRLSDVNLVGDRYILVDVDTSLEHNSYVPLADLLRGGTSLLNAFTNQKIYGFDPQTSLQLRTKFTEDWESIVFDPNLAFFKTLAPNEQFLIAILQYIQYMKQYNIVSQINLESTRSGLKTAFRVYKMKLKEKDTQDLFLRDVEPEKVPVYRALFAKFV